MLSMSDLFLQSGIAGEGAYRTVTGDDADLPGLVLRRASKQLSSQQLSRTEATLSERPKDRECQSLSLFPMLK